MHNSEQKHQLMPLIKDFENRRMGVLDKLASLAIATAKLRAELVGDCGRAEALSVQQHEIVYEFIKRFVILESIDAWILI